MLLGKDIKLKVCLARDRELILKKFRRTMVMDRAAFLPVSFNSEAGSRKFSAEWCSKSPCQFTEGRVARIATPNEANCPSSQPPGHKYGHTPNPLSGQNIVINGLV